MERMRRKTPTRHSPSSRFPSFHKTIIRASERDSLFRARGLAVLAVLTVRESGRIGRRQKLKIGTCAASRQAKCADADGADGVRKQLSVRSSVGLEKLNKHFCQTRRSLVLRHRRLWKVTNQSPRRRIRIRNNSPVDRQTEFLTADAFTT
jgi:hypothetical protein